MRRVVVTGMSMITPIGNATGSDFQAVENNLKNKKSGIAYMADWEKFDGLNTKLAAPIPNFSVPEHYTRKQTRSMGKVALLATVASENAIRDANLLGDPILENGQTGVSYGSSSGSIDAILDFYSMMKKNVVQGISATTYIKMMTHTCAVNIGLFFGLTGRLIQTGTACTSGSMAIGYAFEAIKSGKQTIMIAGGAEELSPTQAAVFDTLYATSTWNDRPHLVPRPFDRDRNGLVIGEGSGTLILEDLDHAQSRGAKIYAEIAGFGTNTDGAHVTQPSAQNMEKVLRLALEDANLTSDKIGYINAHGTSTDHGDIAESHATYNVFGSKTPISSQKSYIGHTLGACGAIEAMMSISMMNNNWYAPTINLDNIDPKCAALDYITGNGREMKNEYVMSNNFAFGGINTSLIFKKWTN
ncbi:MAG: 3-oxoacyl-[acyl-carrier-protein] synthase II [Rickettsiales bacterium]|jgi:3-oxoacyl-[acyl-carrier-protein] synthase II